MWHTVCMLEWFDVHPVDGLKLRLVAGTSGIRRIQFHPPAGAPGECNPNNRWISEAAAQLDEYFRGNLREFHVPLDFQGTEFQLRCWRQLERIPYGETRSYLQIAMAIGLPRAVRAVGAANGANP